LDDAMAKQVATQSPLESAAQVLERGDIYFAYRPKVGLEIARGFEDVARFYTILSRHGKRSYRLMIIGEKRLPAVSGGGDRKSWGFMEKVASRAEEVEDELDPEQYRTRTRGERKVPAARPAGEGIYALVRHGGEHTHLAYALELPAKPGEVQRALNIVEEGSYIISVKNPEAPSPPGMGLDAMRRATFPKHLQERFRGRRFIPVDPPEFLDYPGAEILLVGARQDVYAELGVKLDPEQESETTAEIFRDLKLERALHPLTPLFKGEWE
jgi:hypothetical protein